MRALPRTLVLLSLLLTGLSTGPTHAQPGNQGFRIPTIACNTSPQCPELRAHNICQFTGMKSWYEGKLLRTRYDVACAPSACLPPNSTCWVAGFPEPGRANFINWTSGQKPTAMYETDLRQAGQGYIIEINF
jgi:hypothetical protein